MPPPEFGKSLDGLTLNLLVTDMARAIEFHTAVLGVEIVYSDPDITIVRGFGTRWFIHADHTYDKHPLHEDLAQAMVWLVPRPVERPARCRNRDPAPRM